jgi:phosphopantetheine--protein transferase-like protein
MTKVFFWSSNEEAPEASGASLRPYFDAEFLDGIQSVRNAPLRAMKLRAAALLAHGAEALGVAAFPLVIERTAQGKPFVMGGSFEYSLTHTDRFAAVAFSSHPVGIDAERVTRRIDARRIAEHFFTADEVEELADAAWNHELFFRIWTTKEAFFKREGSGIDDRLRGLSYHAMQAADGSVTHRYAVDDVRVMVLSEDAASEFIDATDAVLRLLQ